MTYSSVTSKDRAIAHAKQMAEEDAAKSSGQPAKKAEEIKEETDELLDEIDTLLEDQEILVNFRQKGGQ